MGGAVSFEQWMAWYGEGYLPAVIVFGAALAGVFLLLVGVRRIHQTGCPSCGYDLAGLEKAAVCPECGCVERRGGISTRWRA